MPTPTSRDDVVADIRRVADDLGRWPTTRDYRHHGAHAVNTVYRHIEKPAGLPDGRDHSWAFVLQAVFGDTATDDPTPTAADGGDA